MANRFSVTLTAEIPKCRSLRAPSGGTSRGPSVSATTVQLVPAGIEPSGSPLPSSGRNSSPSPPNVTLGAPTAMPTRSSGSVPGVKAAGCGRAHPAATASRLARPGFAQGRVELCEREIDIPIGVRARDEARLERRGGEEHATRERGPVPAREERGVRGLRLGEIPHGTGGEVQPPHRARVPRRDGDPMPPRGVPYTRDEPRGSSLERLVETGALGLPQGGEARRHRDRRTRQRPGPVRRALADPDAPPLGQAPGRATRNAA